MEHSPTGSFILETYLQINGKHDSLYTTNKIIFFIMLCKLKILTTVLQLNDGQSGDTCIQVLPSLNIG
jgi:hypothetical protein